MAEPRTLTRALQRLAVALRLQLPAPAAQQAPAATDAPPPRQPAGGPQWHALPGHVLELGDTGFQIVMDVTPHKPLYTLRAPEGWMHAWGSDLPGLQRLGERYAAERAEFTWRGTTYTPRGLKR